MLGAELGDNVSIELFPVLWKYYIEQDCLQRNRYLTNHRSLYSYLWVVTSDTVHRCWSVSVHSYRSKLQSTMRIILFSSWLGIRSLIYLLVIFLLLSDRHFLLSMQSYRLFLSTSIRQDIYQRTPCGYRL